THPTKGAYFTRGTSKNRYAGYSEEGPVYVDNMQRLLRKFETAKSLVPAPELTSSAAPTKNGVIYFGSTSPANARAFEKLSATGLPLDALRIRAFPFADSVKEFIAEHDRVFVVEQNRDGQLRSMLMNELSVDPARLTAILHYDGTPITARFIVRAIASHLE